MNRSFLILSLLLLTLCTSSIGAAPPRVGVITVENGKVSLNGRTISTPQLLEQSAKVVLQKGARARIQLLGDNREITLDGPRTVTVDKAALQKIARPVQRGNMAAVPDIGTTTRSAALTERSERKQLRGFRIVTPPVAEGDLWVFRVAPTETAANVDRQARADWSVNRLDIQGEETLSNGRSIPIYEYIPIAANDWSGQDQAQTITVARTLLVPGQRYALDVIAYIGDTNIGRYVQPFRLLSPEEKAILDGWEAAAQKRARSESSVTPLLELASLYLDWDQMADVRRVMAQARAHPGWAKIEPGAVKRADQLQQTLDTSWDVPVPLAPSK